MHALFEPSSTPLPIDVVRLAVVDTRSIGRGGLQRAIGHQQHLTTRFHRFDQGSKSKSRDGRSFIAWRVECFGLGG